MEQEEILGLEHVSFYRRSCMPKEQGIYFVVAGGRLVYVGQTNNLRHRWDRHHLLRTLSIVREQIEIYWKLFDGSPNQRMEIERSLIQKYRPILNFGMEGAKEFETWLAKGSQKAILQDRENLLSATSIQVYMGVGPVLLASGTIVIALGSLLNFLHLISPAEASFFLWLSIALFIPGMILVGMALNIIFKP